MTCNYGNRGREHFHERRPRTHHLLVQTDLTRQRARWSTGHVWGSGHSRSLAVGVGVKSSSSRGVQKCGGPGFAFTTPPPSALLPAHQRLSEGPAGSQSSSSPKCLLRKQREPGNSCWRGPAHVPWGHTGPSAPPLIANLSGSQRNSPLTQTAGKMTKPIFGGRKRSRCAVFMFRDLGQAGQARGRGRRGCTWVGLPPALPGPPRTAESHPREVAASDAGA